MHRLDPTVNNLSVEELRKQLFQSSWAPVAIKEEELHRYQKLADLLRKFPIRNRKICLLSAPQVNPEATNYRTAKSKRYVLFPHYGFLILTSAIRNFMPSWSVQTLDLHLETLKRSVLGQDHSFETLLELIPDDCDLYGVTMMFESNQVATLRCMEYLVNKGKFVIAGGVQSTADFENLLRHGYCSIVVKKEGETQICKLLGLRERVNSDQFKADEHFQIIYNLAFRDEDEIISFEDKFENPVSLDIRKDYEQIDLDEYNKYGSPNIWTRIVATDRKWATLLTNRGCRGRCTFCQVTNIMGHGVRSRSVSDVINEILFLYHERGVRHLEIIDDDFLANRERALEMFHRWAELKLDLTFSTGAGLLVISFDEEMARAIADAGCIMTGFGIETGNEKRLKTLCKPASLESVREACEIFKRNYRHIWLQANFILGFPNETCGEIMDTFNYGKSLEIDYCQPAILTPIVGTSIYGQYLSINDERVIDRFGKDKMAMHTPGRGLVSRGLTFDDIYKEVYDFRNMDPEKVLTPVEVQQFLIYFNVFLNLVGSVNLKPGGMPEKIKSFTDDVLKAYPMDAVAWGVNARAARLLGDEEKHETSFQSYKKAVKDSTFWSRFFEIYDIPELLELPVR